MAKSNKIAIVILAAGASTRLGHPKQLVPIHNKTLLQHIIEEGLQTNFQPVVVVLGAYADIIKESINSLPVHIVVNSDWKQGMGTSVAAGTKFIQEQFPTVDGLLLLVCDQYFVSHQLLLDIVKKYKKTNRKIVAASYTQSLGVPAFFAKSLFPVLSQLNGGIGARKIIRQNAEDCAVVLFEKGIYDVDTDADLASLKKMSEIDNDHSI